jgi:WD40 repeat protein
MFASGDSDGNVIVWDCEHNTAVATFQHKIKQQGEHGYGYYGNMKQAGVVSSVAFSGDDSKLATTGNDRTVKVWDMATKALIHTFGPFNEVSGRHTGGDLTSSLSFTKYSNRLLFSYQKAAMIADLNADAVVYTAVFPTKIERAYFSLDETKILASSVDKSNAVLHVWNTEVTSQCCRRAHHWSGYPALAKANLSDLVAYAAGSHGIAIWNVATGRLERENLDAHPEGKEEHARSICFTFDDSRLVTNTATGMFIFDAASLALLATHIGPLNAISTPTMMPDKYRIVGASSENGAVLVWDIDVTLGRDGQTGLPGASLLPIHGAAEVQAVCCSNQCMVLM